MMFIAGRFFPFRGLLFLAAATLSNGQQGNVTIGATTSAQSLIIAITLSLTKLESL